MAKIVELPDGREVEFPDGMSNDAIGEVLRKQFPAQPKQSSGYAAPGEEPGVLTQFLGGAKHAWDRAAAGLQSAAGAVGIPTGESLQPLVKQGAQFVKETGPASTIGQVAGDFAMSAAPIVRAAQGGQALVRTLGALKPWQAAAVGLAPEVAANAGYGALTANEGERGTGALLGAGGTLIGASALPLARGMGNVAAHAFGTTTGAGAEAIKQAFKGGPGFIENMRGEVPATAVVEQARAGVQTMRKQMHDAYATARGGWADDTTLLDFRPIGQAYNEAVKKFSFQGVPQPGVEGVKARVEATLNDWLRRAQDNPAFLTVEGLDALKRHLNTIVPEDVSNRAGRAFVSETVNAVKDSIIKQRPQYAEAMLDYWSRSNQLDEIERTLSLGDKATFDTALRKLQSVMRNNANTNYGQRVDLVKSLPTDVMPALAGQTLNSWTPRSLQGAIAGGTGGIGLASGVVGLPAAAAGFATTSPRFVGERAYGMGQAWDMLRAEKMAEALRRSGGVGASSATRQNNPEE